MSVFSWALFRSTKAAVKLHTQLDLRGNIPTFIHISDGKLHDVDVFDILLPEPGAFYIMDRGYVDFSRLFALHVAGAFSSFEPNPIPGISVVTLAPCYRAGMETHFHESPGYRTAAKRLSGFECVSLLSTGGRHFKVKS